MATAAKQLPNGKAERIVEAMRRSVAQRGPADSTFDHVAREASVSRGLLHYYFGTKEQLLVEVVRRDSDLRMELLERQLAGARSADDFIDVLVANLEDAVANDPDFIRLAFDLFTLAQRNPDIAAEYAELLCRTRDHVAAVLAAKQTEGVLSLSADPETTAEILFSLADGLALRMLSQPDQDFSATVAAGVACVRGLVANGTRADGAKAPAAAD